MTSSKRKKGEKTSDALTMDDAMTNGAKGEPIKMDDGDLDWEFTTGSSNSFNFESELDIVLNDLKQTLMEKNRQYGNSALDPVRIFSRASTIEQLYVRIDDKLSRLKRGDSNLDPEDVFVDLFGYLAILMIARNKEKK